MKGGTLGPGEGVLGLAEAAPFSNLSQRLAYGLTPENEHHLVAQRDVRQFQVGAAGPLVGGAAVCWLPWAGPHTPRQSPRAAAGHGSRGSGVQSGWGCPLPASAGLCPWVLACTEVNPGRVTKVAEGVLC